MLDLRPPPQLPPMRHYHRDWMRSARRHESTMCVLNSNTGLWERHCAGRHPWVRWHGTVLHRHRGGIFLVGESTMSWWMAEIWRGAIWTWFQAMINLSRGPLAKCNMKSLISLSAGLITPTICCSWICLLCPPASVLESSCWSRRQRRPTTQPSGLRWLWFACLFVSILVLRRIK